MRVELTGLPYDLIKKNLKRMPEAADREGGRGVNKPAQTCGAGKTVRPKPGCTRRCAIRRAEWYNQKSHMARILFPSGGVLWSDGSFCGSMRLAIHLQRLVQLVEQESKGGAREAR